MIPQPGAAGAEKLPVLEFRASPEELLRGAEMLKSFVLFLLLLFANGFHGQTNVASSNSLPDGVKFPVILIEDFIQEHAAVNDEVWLRVTSKLLGPGRKVVIPKDAIAVARVINTQLPKQKNPARLVLAIEKVQWKNGTLVLNAYIIPPLRPPLHQQVDQTTTVLQRDALLVGVEPHEPAGSALYSKYAIHLPAGTSFMVEQMSKPGPSAKPMITTDSRR